MTYKFEDLLQNIKTGIYVKNLLEFKELIKLLEKYDFTWSSGTKLVDFTPPSIEKEGDVITIYPKEKIITFNGDRNIDFLQIKRNKYTLQDMKNSPIGTKVLINKTEYIKADNWEADEMHFYRKGQWYSYDELIKKGITSVEEPNYNTIYEATKEILDGAEKKYLGNLIKPWKNKVTKIIKKNNQTKTLEAIVIEVTGGNIYNVKLPYFEAGTMYRGMEPNKEYTLEDLGL